MKRKPPGAMKESRAGTILRKLKQDHDRTMTEKDIEFTYQIRRSARRKTVSICVRADNAVVISAPQHLSEKRISEIVEKKSGWIRKKITANREKAASAPAPKTYSTGEKLLFMGSEYLLRVEKGAPSVRLDNGSLIAGLPVAGGGEPSPAAVKYLLRKWYIDRALEEIKKRMPLFAAKVGAAPGRVTLKSMKSRWGSCSTRGTISLAWNIIMAPGEIIDYLIVHELCHLVHHNHSAQYWELVESIIPDARAKRKWLLKNGGLLKL